jgi:hypothetical protein
MVRVLQRKLAICGSYHLYRQNRLSGLNEKRGEPVETRKNRAGIILPCLTKIPIRLAI